MDKFMSEGGSFVTLAKGNRSKAVTAACKKHGGFYLGSIGGPAAILAEKCIKKVGRGGGGRDRGKTGPSGCGGEAAVLGRTAHGEGCSSCSCARAAGLVGVAGWGVCVV